MTFQTRNQTSGIDASVTGYILAGGRSSRMGFDKATAGFGGSTLIERTFGTLREICREVRVVAGSGGSFDGFTCIADVFPDRGAPGGVHAALADCPTESALVLAVDLPFAEEKGLRRLVELASSRPVTNAVVPRDDDGRLQPLCAVYRKAACLPAFAALLESGRPSMRDVIGLIDVEIVDRAEISPDRRFLMNVNTPAEFDAARREAAAE